MDDLVSDSLDEESSSSSSSSHTSSSSSSESSRERRRRRKNKKDRKKRRRRSRSRSRSRSRHGQHHADVAHAGLQVQASEADAAAAADAGGPRYGPPEARIVLCSLHKNDLQPLSCTACKGCAHMIRREVRDQLVVDASGAPYLIPSAKDRLLRKRSDEPIPTLVFSEEELALLETILGQVSWDPRNVELLLFFLSGCAWENSLGIRRQGSSFPP